MSSVHTPTPPVVDRLPPILPYLPPLSNLTRPKDLEAAPSPDSDLWYIPPWAYNPQNHNTQTTPEPQPHLLPHPPPLTTAAKNHLLTPTHTLPQTHPLRLASSPLVSQRTHLLENPFKFVSDREGGGGMMR
jgi:hypothetical protein